MNFQTMDSLGGLVEGNKARMAEDTTRINQENVLAQIAKMAQDQQQSAAMHPLKMQELESQNAERASLGKMRDVQMQESQARVTREQGREYVENMIRFGHLPGAEDTEAERLGIPANHPVRKAVASARKFDMENQGNWGPGEAPQQSKVQELLAALSANDDKSRQATVTAEAAFKKQESANQARLEQERIRQEGANARNKLDNETQKLVSEARIAQANGRIPNANQILGQSIAKVQQVARMPEGPEKNQAMLQAQQDLETATVAIGNVNSARTWADAQADAVRLKQLMPGIQLNPEAFKQPSPTPSPSAPAAGPTKTTSGRTVTITKTPTQQNPNSAAGQGAPSPAVVPAPQSSTEVSDDMIVPATYLDKTLKREGTGQNPRSSAVGVGQFVNDTMLAKFKQWYPDRAARMTDDQILAIRTKEPDTMKEMTQKYAAENARYLRAEGHPVNDSTLYLAHHFGLEGARKVLTASNPGIRVADVLSPPVIKANPFLRHMTVRDLMNWIEQKRFY